MELAKVGSRGDGRADLGVKCSAGVHSAGMDDALEKVAPAPWSGGEKAGTFCQTPRPVAPALRHDPCVLAGAGVKAGSASGLTALGVGSFFIPHLPAVGAAFVCAATVGAALVLGAKACDDVGHWHRATFSHQHCEFLRLDLNPTDNDALRAHYAKQVARGAHAGFIEADALGHITGTHVLIYDAVPPNPSLPRWRRALETINPLRRKAWRVVARLGVERSDATPVVHLAFVHAGHYRGLERRCVGEGASVLREVECGGGGDCLFHAMRFGLRQARLASANADAAQLRALTAQRIARDPAYTDDRIRSQTANAWFEYEDTHVFARSAS